MHVFTKDGGGLTETAGLFRRRDTMFGFLVGSGTVGRAGPFT